MTHLVPYAVKLARYHAAKPALAKKHAAMLARRRRLRLKRKAKAELRAVLALARAAMGWKPLGRKPSPEQRAGQMLVEGKKAGQLAKAGDNQRGSPKPSTTSIGT